MRKPVYLAVVGISIIVAAGSLGVSLTRYIGLRAYSPKGTAQAAVPLSDQRPPLPPRRSGTTSSPPGTG